MAKSFNTALITALPAFVLGVWFGYEKGVVNQVAYDAPARIALYDAAIRSDEPKEALRSMAISQAKLMVSLQASGATFSPLLGLPATKGLSYSYDTHSPVVKNYLE
ncbi:hypothetical protein [Microbulbifer pacificus]|uniref:Uncharacterized protein n=1 Tax=Microbulbifer pacificus TaxID=407164 RepID=A0AAU0N1Q0_9GAMM|nr:hypothetical protein [Microbulbifer pacificus]WOX05554.1 hypothetical protein R5R33_17715 [Microbulbifer pacificus]